MSSRGGGLGLLDFAAGMPGGLARKDQPAAGELYVRGLLADGRREPVVPVAGRPGGRPSAAAAVSRGAGQGRELPGGGERALGGRGRVVCGGLALSCPGSWGEAALAGPVAAAAARRRGERAGIPAGVRHTGRSGGWRWS